MLKSIHLKTDAEGQYFLEFEGSRGEEEVEEENPRAYSHAKGEVPP